VEHLFWYLTGAGRAYGLFPFLRALFVCTVLYQIGIAVVLARWLAEKVGILASRSVLEPHNRHPAVIVLPTLLRAEEELDGLKRAMRSVAQNEYPGHLVVVACIDGQAESSGLFPRLQAWAAGERLPRNVEMHVVGTPVRMGKAMAMDRGVEHVKTLVAAGRLPRFPVLFFNMDADSTLGKRALERMAFRLTRKRWLTGTPRLIVTSNVLVPPGDGVTGLPSLLSARRWLATLVGREYLTSISLARSNTGIVPVTEVSGALYCTWSQVYLPAPRYARFLQSLRWIDWLKWWFGFAPPRFSDYRGAPLVEAMTGPGDDTWMTWLACSGTWKNGRICFEFPRTPLHAFGRMVATWVSRPLSFDPLAQVFTKTPTTVVGLFRQRLRWNSSRMQDIKRWSPALAYHWQMGLSVLSSSLIAVACNVLFVAGVVVVLVRCQPSEAMGISVLAGAGYACLRLVGTVIALLVSECPMAHWICLVSLPASGLYHVVFNTMTWILGSARDVFWLGQPTNFMPESTARASGLSRFALVYRLRRAVLLACRALIFGDVPVGRFWLGWRETPWTPSGFDGWTSGVRPPPVYWPSRRRTKPGTATAVGGGAASDD
jgi:hypothetical protein